MANSVNSNPQISASEGTAASNQNGPAGIGGLLIVIAVGLCFSALQNLFYVIGSFTPILRRSLWTVLTDPQSVRYHPHWKLFLTYQAVISLCFAAANTLALVLFFRRRRVFPKVIVVLIPVLFLFSVVAHYWSGLIPSVFASQEYGKEGHALVVRFIGLHIWIPYFLVSKRVEATFTY
jgi:hypothetical protein